MKRTFAAAVGVVLLVAAGAAFASGLLGPGAASGTDVETFPTETPGPSTGDDATAPFTTTVDRVEQCGRTCRNVTTTLTNEQETTAEDVTVYTRVYAGNGTGGDVVWENRRRVGTLPAGGSVTVTERVSLSVTDALNVRRNDGWVTVRTTVQSAGKTVTVTERRDVA